MATGVQFWFDEVTPTATNLVGHVRTLSINRGRESPLDDMRTATCTIVANNHTRALDPDNAAGPYYGNLAVGNKVTITVDGVSLFVGEVDDFDFSYRKGNASTVEMMVVDDFGELAKADIAADTAAGLQMAAGDDAGLRALIVLSSLNRYSARAVDLVVTGSTYVSTLQGDIIPASTNVLRYLNLVARTELGRLFVDREGSLRFLGRGDTTGTVGVELALGGASGTIPFAEVDTAKGVDVVHNRVIVSRVGGSTETFVDTDSVAAIRRVISTEGTFTGLLYADDAQSAAAGLYLIDALANAAQQFVRFGIHLGRLSPTQRTTVLEFDIGGVVDATYIPAGVGTALEQTCIIEGIRHNITRGAHFVELYVSSLL